MCKGHYVKTVFPDALAMLCVTGIKKASGTTTDWMPFSDFDKPLDTTLVAQVIQLKEESVTSWAWLGAYESFNATNVGEAAGKNVSKKTAVVEVPAHLMEYVKGTLECHTHKGKITCVWMFTTLGLSALADLMWDRQIKGHRHLILSKTPTPTFPMRSSGSCKFLFVSTEGSANLVAGPQDGSAACFLCGETCSIKKIMLACTCSAND